MKKIIPASLLLAASWSIIPTIAERICSKKIKKRGPGRPEIALTFDDGPDPAYTPLLLDTLKQYNVKATFFVIGRKAKLYPDLLRRIQEEGHDIGIHNHRHISNWLLSPSQMEEQLDRSAESVSSIIGKPVTLYRPPWGHFNPYTLTKASRFETIMWTSIPGDWKKKMTAEQLANKLRYARSNGAIITLHDSGDTFGAYEKAPLTMIDSLHLFLSDDESNAFKFVTVNTLFRK